MLETNWYQKSLGAITAPTVQPPYEGVILQGQNLCNCSPSPGLSLPAGERGGGQRLESLPFVPPPLKPQERSEEGGLEELQIFLG